MKVFFILLILITSVLSALFLNLNHNELETATDVSQTRFSLKDKFNDNFSIIKYITKDAEIQKASKFEFDSFNLIQKVKENSQIPQDFIQDYDELTSIINKTSRSIKTKKPTLSREIVEMDESLETYNNKIKSIGLIELSQNWRDMQKLYKKILRQPYESDFREYELKNAQAKQIITELYLEDNEERYLFSFIEKHKSVLSGFEQVYTDVGLKNIRDIKPLVYTLKEHMQKHENIFDQAI